MEEERKGPSVPMSPVVKTSLDVPSNSDRALSDERRTHEARVQRVVTNPDGVKRKKEGFGSKLKKAFFGEDVVDVKDYILFDVLIPAVKSTISEMVGNGVDMVLFGEVRRSKKKDKHTSYASYYRSDRDSRDSDRRSLSRRSAFEYDDIILESRGEAEEVIGQLQDLAFDYGQASVADLYDLVGQTGNFTDERWGWFKGDLRSASVRRVRDGYLLELPRPARLD